MGAAVAEHEGMVVLGPGSLGQQEAWSGPQGAAHGTWDESKRATPVTHTHADDTCSGSWMQ
eukprot:1154951-Pelagomonas_calceolata.AAC.5